MPSDLRWLSAPTSAAGAVLVFHGGASLDTRPVHWYDHAVLRLLPVARAASRGNRRRLAVALLKNDVFGWNAHSASPMADARLAVDAVASRYPGMPIGLVGHSMGGRVAHQLLPDRRVTSVLGLAPWIEPTDPLDLGPEQRLLFIHGDRDTITDPRRSDARALAAEGGHASVLTVRGGDHPMLRRVGVWHQAVSVWCATTVLGADPPKGIDPKVAQVVSAAARSRVVGEL